MRHGRYVGRHGRQAHVEKEKNGRKGVHRNRYVLCCSTRGSRNLESGFGSQRSAEPKTISQFKTSQIRFSISRSYHKPRRCHGSWLCWRSLVLYANVNIFPRSSPSFPVSASLTMCRRETEQQHMHHQIFHRGTRLSRREARMQWCKCLMRWN